jgi:plasmid maintenance system antidote protein VapI
MATKKAAQTKELRENEFGPWVAAQIGEKSVTNAAAEVGIERPTLSGIITGRRSPGKEVAAKLKKIGLVRVEKLYIVKA